MPLLTLRICRDPSARYVTQSSFYDRVGEGKALTDRRIHQLELTGRYGDDAKRKAEEKELKKKKPVKHRRIKLIDLSLV